MIQIPLEIGDTILTGRFKNKKVTVKEIGIDDYGNPTINGRSILKIRIPKLYQKQENEMNLKENKKLMFVRSKNIPRVTKEYGLTFDEIYDYEQFLINKSVPELRKLQSIVSQQQDKFRTFSNPTPQQIKANKQLEFRDMMLLAAVDYVAFEKPKNKLKEANMSSSEMKQRMLDGIQKDGTAFEIRGAYGNCELWANGTRLEAGSVKDCYNAWIKYRFNPKYEKKTTTNIDYKDDVVKVLNLKQGEKYISIMGSEPLEVEYIGRATNPVNHKFKVLKHNDEYVLNPYDVQKYIKFPLSENKSKLKENNNTNFKVDDIILKYTTKSKLQPLLIKIAEIASTYWSLSVQERNKIDREYVKLINDFTTNNLKDTYNNRSTIYPDKSLGLVMNTFIAKKYTDPIFDSAYERNKNKLKEEVKPFQKSPIEVKIRKDGDRFHIFLQTIDGEQQLSIQGYETKEQAEHAAMMKGYKYDGNPYFEKHKGIEVPKATKSEPVKHDKPKEMKLGKEKELKLENFIRKVIRMELSKKKVQLKEEVEVNDTEIAEYAKLVDQIDKMKAELSKLTKRFDELDDKFRKMLDVLESELGESKENFIRYKNILITIKRKGYERTNYKYKEAFEELYKKVNANMKKMIDEVLEANKTITKVSSSLSVQYEVDNFITTIFNRVKTWFVSFIGKLRNTNKSTKQLLDQLEMKV